MIRLPILILCATLPAVEIAGRTVAVDRPGDWYDPTASHHAQHAAMGVPTGLASACIDDPLARYGTSFASGLAVGLAYEVYQSKDGAWIDAVDAGWVAAGSLLTTALVDLTGEAVQILVTDDSAAVAVAWGF